MATKTKTEEISEVRTENVEGAIELGRIMRAMDLPWYVHGAPGVGKSDIAKQLAKDDGILDEKGNPKNLIDIRVGTMLPEDLTGIPVPDLEKRLAVWLRATFWPDVKRDGKTGVILFDELSDANKQLQSCIYRVILDRQIGDYKLPEGWWPMAAGNRRQDRAAAQSLSSALANRFGHTHVRADYESWCRWANVNDIDPMLIGFIKWQPQLIHSMDGADLLAFPTPRSWAMASKVFNCAPDVRFRLLAGIVGEGAATMVNTYFNTIDLPDFEEIVAQPMKATIPDSPASRYALTSLLSRRMDKDNFPQIYKYIMRDDFGADYGTVVVLDAAKRDSTLTETPTFVNWAKKNKSLRL